MFWRQQQYQQRKQESHLKIYVKLLNCMCMREYLYLRVSRNSVLIKMNSFKIIFLRIVALLKGKFLEYFWKLKGSP